MTTEDFKNFVAKSVRKISVMLWAIFRIVSGPAQLFSFIIEDSDIWQGKRSRC